jgi:hypothetical protein
VRELAPAFLVWGKQVTSGYRAVLGEILAGHLGSSDLAAVFPAGVYLRFQESGGLHRSPDPTEPEGTPTPANSSASSRRNQLWSAGACSRLAKSGGQPLHSKRLIGLLSRHLGSADLAPVSSAEV